MEPLFRQSDQYLAGLPQVAPRTLFKEINWDNRLIGILGPRGVGKTTLLLQRLKSLEVSSQKAVYVVLDDIYFAANRLQHFVEVFYQSGGRRLFLDEVHRYPPGTWAQEVKTIFDLYPDLYIVFTGSSVLRISQEKADLSRRLRTYHLPGLSFREFLQFRLEKEFPRYELVQVLENHRQIAAQFQKSFDILPNAYLTDYWRFGYYPFFLSEMDGYFARLNEVIKLSVDQDLSYATGSTPVEGTKIARLLYAIATSAPFKPNVDKLSSLLGLSRVSILKYFELLERGQLLLLLRSAGTGVGGMKKPEKIYLDNPNLIYALSPHRADVGAIRETFLANQLKHFIRTHSGLLPPELVYPKTGDFELRLPDREYLFEVGGPGKGFSQIGRAENHYVVADVATSPHAQKVPLWLFGFLY